MSNDNATNNKNANAYAKVAFAIAHKESRVSEWDEALKIFAEGIQPVQHLLSMPTVSRAQWVVIANELTQKSELPAKESALITELAEKRLLHLLPRISSAFQALDRKSRGAEDIRITTALPMSTEQVDKITADLKNDFNVTANKITVTIDKSLIGGAIVEFGDNVIDGSVKNSLLQMSRSLKR